MASISTASGPSENFNVFVYSDAGGFPGSLVASRIGMSYVQNGSTFTVTLSPAIDLTSGTYWISVQSRMDFALAGNGVGRTGRCSPIRLPRGRIPAVGLVSA
jgi:hypothetical protein